MTEKNVSENTSYPSKPNTNTAASPDAPSSDAKIAPEAEAINPKEQRIHPDEADSVPENGNEIPFRTTPEGRAANIPKYVVGIGASAGGLEALQELIEAIPPRTDMAFVIIQHLSPDYRSMMDDLLARKTEIPIHTSEDKMLLEADNIYLLPPKKEMIVSNGRLLLTERTQVEVLNLPINTFLRSMAESYQERCVAIILSGTGSDGTHGAISVHDNGGMVLVQDPETAAFDGMPNSAISSGKADLVLSPKDMSLTMIRYAARTSTVAKQIAQSAKQEENRFAEIALLLNSRMGLDLSQYKPSTITRRIERRLSMQGSSLEEYTRVLLDNSVELDLLYQDLLIGVTHFFRDKPAFNSLRSQISTLLQERSKEDEIRVWVAGCATGQEAYSLAILLLEAREKANSNVRFKIFATDIHQRSIDKAARGIYREDEIAGISSQRRGSYLKHSGDGLYQVTPELRQCIVFAQHNLLEDAPFTKIDLLTCRNLLIYFNQSAQQRVLSLFTFALKNKGVLFLGSSESLGRHEQDFKEIDIKNKIFQKTRDSQYRPQRKVNLDRGSALKTTGWLSPESRSETHKEFQLSTKRQKAFNALLQRFVPASVLIDDSADILQVFGNAGDFLSVDAGAPSINLRSFLKDPAKLVLSHMIGQVKKNRKGLSHKAVQGFANFDAVDIDVYPMSDSPADIDSMLVSMRASDTPPTQALAALDTDIAQPDNFSLARLKDLEDELQHTRENLQTTVEELETSNEELQATNEELMAANEEMQTTNEELQSVNEELVTVNVEYQAKEKLQLEAEADEKSIVETSGMHIVFLDMQLNIRKYSAPAAQLLGLSAEEIGRPFATVSNSLVQRLLGDINRVLTEGCFVEKEFVKQKGEVYQLQIKRLDNNLPDNSESRGVLLTFTNISAIYVARERMTRSENRLQSLLDSMTDGFLEWFDDDDKLYLSEGTQHALGYPSEHQLTWPELLADRYDDTMAVFQQHRESQQPLKQIMSLRQHNGEHYRALCKGQFDTQQRGELTRTRFSGQLIDINRFMQFEDDLKTQMRDLSRSNEILEEFAHIISHDLKAPLRHATHSLDFLRDALDKQDKAATEQEMLELRQHMDSLKNLIDDVIRFSRVSSEKKHETTVDLNQVLKHALDVHADLIEDKHIQLEQDELPSVPGDKHMLQHVFQNLIGNACKYNDKTQPNIAIRYEMTQDHYLIHIQDNGIGFNIEYKDNMMKPFKRLVTKEQYEGSGIGLAICKILTEQHNGELQSDSVVGEGSTFTVKLPNKKLAQ